MSASTSLPGANVTSTWLHRWIYYLAAGFMFAAAALRAILIFADTPYLGQIMLLLAAWLALFILDLWHSRSRRRSWLTIVFLALEAGLIVFLLWATKQDFFGFLFSILGMQAMQHYSPRITSLLIGLEAVLTFVCMLGPMGALQAFALSLIYTGGGAFLAAYIWTTRRAGVVQEQQQALVWELQAANRQLQLHAARQEQLAAGRERQHLARELHDSVTQTIFSMTLTTQSALLLLERDRSQVAGQLDRLDQLAQSAMAEIQVLISRLASEALTGGGFVSALQRHLEERRRLENLTVALEVEGTQRLDPLEEAGLFRIAQEALNNVVKHARVLQATVRLHLAEPLWMEVEDCGAGFDPQQVLEDGRMGMAGMGERAAEIGWSLRVKSAPGGGTRIRVEKGPGGAKQT